MKVKKFQNLNREKSNINSVTEEEWKQEETKLIEKYKNLRKASILDKLPFDEWTKEELIDLIDEYNVYFIMLSSFNQEHEKKGEKIKKQILPISLFVNQGEYRRLLEWTDEYRKDY